MAENRAAPSGIAADIAKKIQGNRDSEAEQQAVQWMTSVVGEKFPDGSYDDALRDGVYLCKLINKISPNSVKKIFPSNGQAFVLMQNAEAFNKALVAYGVPKEETFQTVDLYEKKNIPAVTKSIYALSRTAHAKGWRGPLLGPKLAEENKREFTDEQLRSGDSHIGLQMGYNKGANQSGINFGKSRMVLD